MVIYYVTTFGVNNILPCLGVRGYDCLLRVTRGRQVPGSKRGQNGTTGRDLVSQVPGTGPPSWCRSPPLAVTLSSCAKAVAHLEKYRLHPFPENLGRTSPSRSMSRPGYELVESNQQQNLIITYLKIVATQVTEKKSALKYLILLFLL